MNNEIEIKEIVKEKYSSIASQSKSGKASTCCDIIDCCNGSAPLMAEDYSSLEGYNPDADLGLGCGIPTQFAKIKEGDTVIDLGSGAGNDAFVARGYIGESGKVIGVDFTEAMIEKARLNAEKAGFNNVEFRFGDIEKIPVSENTAHVVLSNCVLNLVPDKRKAFAEIYRVLKPNGHFSISDIVLKEELPDKLKKVAEMYAGCISGAIEKKDYLKIIEEAGFENIVLAKEKPVLISDSILLEYISKEELEEFKLHHAGIYSITVYAEKPGACCEPGCCK